MRIKKKDDEFVDKDVITGRKLNNPLNKKKLSDDEMDSIMLEDES